MTVLYAILLFGFLVFIHESGHFLFARLFHVTVKEFAIGMGPKLLSTVSKRSGIRYSLRLFPIGGFVSMAGEDEESDDPNSLNKKPVWQRMIITAAGGVINVLFGVLLMSILVMSTSDKLASNRIAVFTDGGTIYSADGAALYGRLYEITGTDGEKLTATDGGQIYGSLAVMDSGKNIVTLVRIDPSTMTVYACDLAGERVSIGVSFTNEQTAENPLYRFTDGTDAPFSAVSLLEEYRWGVEGEEDCLRIGDAIVSVVGRSTHIYTDLSYEVLHSAMRRENVHSVTYTDGDGAEQTVYYVLNDLVVIRDGQRVKLRNVAFATNTASGVVYGDTSFLVYRDEQTFGNVMKHGWFQSVSTIKMIWESLGDMVLGRYGISAVSGPVGVTKTLSEAAKSGVYQFVYLAVALTMNLGIVNLLPLPALDGGRLFFQLVELIFRRPINRKAEAMVHFVGIVILMLLMVAITVKDVVGLF